MTTIWDEDDASDQREASEPTCWAEAPGGGVRCGLGVDHDGDHHFNIWTSQEARA